MKVDEQDLKRFAKENGISPRELDVISCMLNRQISIKDIAKALNLSPSTVNNHLNNIFTKTKTSSKAELMVCLIHGLTEKISNLEEYKKTPKVLVIDDEPDICLLLKHELEACGFSVFVESDSLKALELVSKHELDFIISDIRMPQLSGYELLQKVRGLHKYKPEIIFMTGYSEYSQEYAYHLGAIAMFSKPVPSSKIVSTLMESFIEETSNKKKYRGLEKAQEGLINEPVMITSENIGTGGMFLKFEDTLQLMNDEFEVGKRLELSLVLPNSNSNLPDPAVVEVKWRRIQSNNGYPIGLGVKFVEIADKTRDGIYNFTRQHDILSYIPIGKASVGMLQHS